MTTSTPDTVRSYLQEICRYSLLTPTEEISYARLVQQMMAIEKKRELLTQQLNRQPTDSELATSLGKTEAEVQSIIQHNTFRLRGKG